MNGPKKHSTPHTGQPMVGWPLTRPTPMNLSSIVAKLALAAIVLSACSDRPETTSPQTTLSTETVSLSPSDRTVLLRTTGCGSANDGTGSGILIDADSILTAAHVVASSDSVTVESPSDLFDRASATVVILDRAADLALITVDDEAAGTSPLHRTEAVAVGRADLFANVSIFTTTGSIAASVIERSRIQTNEVRGTERVERVAYRLNVGTSRGDSGAGVYAGDSIDAKLVGVVFANSADIANTSWAVAGSELEAFLAESPVRSDTASIQRFRCDKASSRLVVDDN